MRRALAASVLLHATIAVGVWLLALDRPDRSRLPPVYQVSLVSAAEVAPKRTRPEPKPPEPVEEERPEPEEAVPDPDEATPEKPKPREDRPTPKAGPERADARGAESPVTLEGKPFPFPWYLDQLVRKVERNWRPTSNTLSATVHFRIAANGRIGEVKVHESSGNFLFDQAAKRAVEAAGPLPPLPDEYQGDWLGVYFVFDTEVRQS